MSVWHCHRLDTRNVGHGLLSLKLAADQFTTGGRSIKNDVNLNCSVVKMSRGVVGDTGIKVRLYVTFYCGGKWDELLNSHVIPGCITC
jgi:hypothetical protein